MYEDIKNKAQTLPHSNYHTKRAENIWQCGAFVERTPRGKTTLSSSPSRYTLLMFFSTFEVTEHWNFNHAENKGSRLGKKLLNLKEWNNFKIFQLRPGDSQEIMAKRKQPTWILPRDLYQSFGRTLAVDPMQTNPFILTPLPAFWIQHRSSGCLCYAPLYLSAE